MKNLLLLLVVGVALVSGFTEDEYRTKFSEWMAEHGKIYTSEEFSHRFNIFSRNMDYVEEWNSQGSSTVLGLNKMADLSNSEYRNIYLGTRINRAAELEKAKHNPFISIPETPLADIVDWRTKGVLTPIKDQGQCGSCWSFSTTGSTEAAHYLATGKLVSLSEQNLMDCSYTHGNLACEGGLMTSAFDYIIKNKGIDTEESYPYTAQTHLTCHYSVAQIGATISSYKVVAAGSESALQAAVSVTPVSIAIDASHNSFQLYKSGTYYEPSCSASNLDHGVLVVGYGSSNTTDDYWIVKNSWGTSWGLTGYIQMARNRNNNCGIATEASYPII